MPEFLPVATVEQAQTTGVVADGAAVGALFAFGLCIWRQDEDFETIAIWSIAGAIGNAILYVL